MIGEGIPIGRIFGISIRIHISWFLIFGLLTWALTIGFPSEQGLAVRVTAAVITSLLFFMSVLLHELMHSVVAIRNKIPVKSITLFIFGGVSQITEEPQKPGVEFRVAIAGPLTSLILGGFFYGFYYLFPGLSEIVKSAISLLGYTNLVLGLFNLVPAFPMDGGRVLRSIIWWRTRNLRRATQIASSIGRGIAVFMILGGIYWFFIGGGFNGLWIALIGWFIYSAASSSYQQLVIQQTLQGHAAKEIMSRDCPLVRPELSVDKLINDVVLPSGKRCFMVSTDSKPQGMVTLQEIRDVPGPERTTRTVGQIMKPVNQLKTVSPEEDLATVMRILTDINVNQVPVMDKGELVGMIARDNLLNFIRLKESVGV